MKLAKAHRSYRACNDSRRTTRRARHDLFSATVANMTIVSLLLLLDFTKSVMLYFTKSVIECSRRQYGLNLTSSIGFCQYKFVSSHRTCNLRDPEALKLGEIHGLSVSPGTARGKQSIERSQQEAGPHSHVLAFRASGETADARGAGPEPAPAISIATGLVIRSGASSERINSAGRRRGTSFARFSLSLASSASMFSSTRQHDGER